MFSSPWTLVLAVALAAVHLEAERLRATLVVPRRVWISLAGGASLAYVFIHILPELSAEQETLSGSRLALLPFLEHHAYLVALGGFATFYGLERLGERRQQDSSDTDGETTDEEVDEGEEDDKSDDGDWVFKVHLASFTLYNVVIGYLLVHRIDTGLWNLLFYFLAMGFHFLVTDAGFRRLHERPYHRYGRWVLAAAVVGGWTLGELLAISEVDLALLFAFLAGAVVLNVVKEELPDQQQSDFAAFAVGAAGYATLLLFL
ncbi:hypothetical protein AUR64_18415 [Haloprofundus marisrubri]|uniref:ZIP Zinc transporter n=1 Tax=Haloprofundus marisrubri TaxID=1514971 RepID=A0A0W1R6Y0_9EURY|nr:hypothetical protein [Haloprofundus marisrubri]KTG08640.1 hypothetical protein AUR64_18415 [Haloprofundus marisrubri]